MSKPISFRLPKEQRQLFDEHRGRFNMSEGEYAQKLVLAGLLSDTSDQSGEDFLIKNVAFMTQILSELLEKFSPEDRNEILERARSKSLHIFEKIRG